MEINKIIKFGEKFGDVSISVEKESKSEIIYSNRKASKFVEGEEVSLGIRISRGKKFGYAFTTNIDNWKDTIIRAAKIMKVSKDLENEVPIVERKKMPSLEKMYYKEIAGLSSKDIFEHGEELVSSVDSKFNIPMASISKYVQERLFANSNGVNLKHKESGFSSSIEVSNSYLNSYDFHTTHNIHDVSKIGKSASKLLDSKLNAKKISSFKGSVLFDYFAVSDLMESVIIPAVLASNVQTRRSRFTGKLGEQIFSDKITVYDNGILPSGLFSSKFDGEGERRQKTIVFKKGVLKNYLYDNFSAEKDNTTSTGNSNGIEVIPNISASNFILSKGKYSHDKLISEIKHGLFVRELVGTHLINKITGDCSVGVDDVFYVKDGEIKYPVKQAMVSFNLFDALKKVEMVGNKYRQESSVISPQILFEDVQVIG